MKPTNGIDLVSCEAIQVLAEISRPLVDPGNICQAPKYVSMFLMACAFNLAYFGREGPQLAIGDSTTIETILAKINYDYSQIDQGPMLKGEKEEHMGWVKGECWYRSARFFVIRGWPVGELFFFNANRLRNGKYQSAITGIEG